MKRSFVIIALSLAMLAACHQEPKSDLITNDMLEGLKNDDLRAGDHGTEKPSGNRQSGIQ